MEKNHGLLWLSNKNWRSGFSEPLKFRLDYGHTRGTQNPSCPAKTKF